MKALHFYRDLLGMTLLQESHHGVGTENGFSLYFLAHVPEDAGPLPPIDTPEAKEYIKKMFGPV